MRCLFLCCCLLLAGCSQSALTAKWQQWTSHENLYNKAMSWGAKQADCSRLHYAEYRDCQRQYRQDYHSYQKQRENALTDAASHRQTLMMLDSPSPIPRQRPVIFGGYPDWRE